MHKVCLFQRCNPAANYGIKWAALHGDFRILRSVRNPDFARTTLQHLPFASSSSFALHSIVIHTRPRNPMPRRKTTKLSCSFAQPFQAQPGTCHLFCKDRLSRMRARHAYHAYQRSQRSLSRLNNNALLCAALPCMTLWLPACASSHPGTGRAMAVPCPDHRGFVRVRGGTLLPAFGHLEFSLSR